MPGEEKTNTSHFWAKVVLFWRNRSMDKTKERAFVETTRKRYPWFPPGDIVEHEAPDFLLVDGTDRIGIEVTQLFQRPKHWRTTPAPRSREIPSACHGNCRTTSGSVAPA